MTISVLPTINEIIVNTAATDQEFLELAGTPGSSLDGFTILEVESGGVIDTVIDLSGSFGGTGFFLLASPEAESDLGVTADLPILNNTFTNASQTYLLVQGFVGSSSDDIDANNDGVIDNEPWSSIVDSVAIIENDGPTIYSTNVLGPDGNFLAAGGFRDPAITGDFLLHSFDDPSLYSPMGGGGDLELEINEYRNDFNDTVTDVASGERDFVELIGPADFTFGNLFLVEVAGDDFEDVSRGSLDPGVITNVVPLSGATTDDIGILVVGNNANPRLAPNDVGTDDFDLLVSAGSIFVARDFTGEVGEDLDTNDDGTFDVMPFSEVVVGLSLEDDDTDVDQSYFEDIIPANSATPDFVEVAGERIPDVTGSFTFNVLDDLSTDSNSILNTGTGFAAVANQVALPEGDAGTTTFEFEVQRFGDVSGTDTVEFSAFFRALGVDDPSRIAGTDPTVTTLTFAPDETVATVLVDVTANTVEDPISSVGIALSNPSLGTSVVVPEASSLVVDDDNDDGMIMESFELPEGITYELIDAFDDGFFDYFDRFEAPSEGGGRDEFQYGFDLDFAIFGQDLDGEGGPSSGIIRVPDLPIVEFSNPQVSVRLGALAGDPLFTNYEGSNGVRIFAGVDGGARELIGQFSPSGDEGDLELGDLRLDADFDGIGEGARLTETLVPFTFDIPGSGLFVDIEIEIDSNAGFEPIVVDKVTVADTGNIEPEFTDLKIHDIQGFTLLSDGTLVGVPGAADESPFAGEFVRVQGVVTADFAGTASLEGFYLQEEESDYDNSPFTSEGAFIYAGSLVTPTDVEIGEIVTVEGIATERDGETSIVAINVVPTGRSEPLPAPVELTLPTVDTLVDADGDFLANLEQYEGMLVSIEQPLSVTELFQLGRFGTFRVSSDGRLEQFTQNNDPDEDGFLQHLQDIAARSLVIDDGLRVQNPDDILVPDLGEDGILNGGDVFRMGDTYTDLTGVLSFSEDSASGSEEPEYRIHTPEATLSADNPRPETPEDVGGDIQVASFNVLNFFTTLDDGRSFNDNPLTSVGLEPRGADDLTPGITPDTAEYDRQLAKLVEAIIDTGADVLGLIELENEFIDDQTLPTPPEARLPRTIAIQELVDALNDELDAEIYDWVEPLDENGNLVEFVGTDAISTGLIYRTDTVQQVGDSAFLVFEEASSAATQDVADVLNPFVDSDDQLENLQRNRPALAATFEPVDDEGAAVTIAVNHFKSKGDSGLEDLAEAAQDELDNGEDGFTQEDIDALLADPNFDAGDGAAFWTEVRADAARELIEWLDSDPTGSGDPDYLVIGDLNAYRQEDPITVFEDADYTDLGALFDPDGYSFVFDGQLGTLDYGLSNPSLTDQITGATDWHINADEPSVFDYNLEFGRDETLFTPDQFRSSDHDPLIVGIEFDGPPLAIDDEAETTIGEPVEIDVLANDSDPSGSDLQLVSVTDPENGTATITDDNTILYTPDDGFAGTDTFEYTAINDAGRSSSGSVTVTVDPFTDGVNLPPGEDPVLPPVDPVDPDPVDPEQPVVEVNRAPVARPDIFVGVLGEVIEGNVFADNGFGRDFDPDFDRIRAVRINGEGGVIGEPFELPSGATVTLESNGNLSYDAGDIFGDVATGETVTDRFSYRISDGLGGRDFAFVDIELTAPELVTGTADDDSFEVSGFDAAVKVDGGAGTDTLVMQGVDFGDAVVRATEGGFSLSEFGGGAGGGETGAVSITDIEQIVFDDVTITVTDDPEVVRLALVYDAAFDRFGDAAGIGFWAGVFADGASIGEIADVFAESDEFAALWGEDLANEAYVAVIYENSLDREPDDGGLDFWTQQLDDGVLDRGDVLVAFAEANETAILQENEIDDGVLVLLA